MQLRSSNLTKKCFTMSPKNPFILGSKGQRSRSRGTKNCRRRHGALASVQAKMEPGRPGHGSSGRRVNILGRVGSRVNVQYTWPGLLTPIRRYKNVLSIYWCAVTVSVFGSSGTGRLSTVSILAAIWYRQRLYVAWCHERTWPRMPAGWCQWSKPSTRRQRLTASCCSLPVSLLSRHANTYSPTPHSSLMYVTS